MSPLWAAWHWRPDVGLVLGMLALVYVTGWWRLRRRGRAAARTASLGLYLGGLGVVGVALLSPLDTLGALLFTLHMGQHQLLATVAAPLLLLANPLPAVLWGLPGPVRRGAGRLLAGPSPLRTAVAAATWLPVAWVTYGLVLVTWHLPVAFQAALGDAWVHDLQHVSFLTAGLLFWFPLICPAPRVRGPGSYGLRMLYVLGALGLPMVPLMSFAVLAPRLLYPHYATVPRLWGLSPLEDQATGWILMGTLDATVYGIAFFRLMGRFLAQEERLITLREGVDPGLRDLPP